MRIVFLGTGWRPIVDAIRARLDPGASIVARHPGQPLAALLADADVILPSNCPVGAAELDLAPHVRLVQQPAAGYDAIDLEAARARGVPVANAPGANATAVVETALYLLLALARRAPEAAKSFRAASIGVPLGVELRGRTLLVVGVGRTGAGLATVARALGMNVITARSTTTKSELLALLREADAVSLHCPLNDRTRGLLDAEALSAAKHGILVVNTARGPIIDRPSIEAALASGQVGGLGLDVFWEEPWDPSAPLFARDDVVTLPHLGGSTEEAFARIADIVVENVRRTVRGEPLLHRLI